MRKLIYPGRAFLLGLAVSQVLATYFVYESNRDLGTKLRLLEKAGFLIVPNQHVLPGLNSLGPAFFGGVFFTLSWGAALAFIPILLAWLWVRLLKRSLFALLVYLQIWLGMLVLFYVQGPDPMAITFVLLLPPLVFAATLRFMPAREKSGLGWRMAAFILPLLTLILIGSVQLKHISILDIRDFVLLANPIGRGISDFYYRYTLYPAEVFKSLAQKTLKSCQVSVEDDPKLLQRLKRIMVTFDYLPVEGTVRTDLTLRGDNKILILFQGEQRIMEEKTSLFLGRAAQTLKTFSEKTDRHRLLRRTVFVSMLLSITLVFYFGLFALVNWPLNYICGLNPAVVLAGVLILVLGLISMFSLFFESSQAQDFPVQKLLSSQRWPERVVGLRKAAEQGLDVNKFGYRKFLTSDKPAERYWVAVALGHSRTRETYEAIITLLDDPQPIVACQAYRALGQRRERKRAATTEIINRISNIRDWYIQWYAYRALRSLGWKQHASP